MIPISICSGWIVPDWEGCNWAIGLLKRSNDMHMFLFTSHVADADHMMTVNIPAPPPIPGPPAHGHSHGDGTICTHDHGADSVSHGHSHGDGKVCTEKHEHGHSHGDGKVCTEKHEHGHSHGDSKVCTEKHEHGHSHGDSKVRTLPLKTCRSHRCTKGISVCDRLRCASHEHVPQQCHGYLIKSLSNTKVLGLFWLFQPSDILIFYVFHLHV